MIRICTSCLPDRVPAQYVASGPEDIPGHPMQWYECGKHAPTDNLAEVERVSLVPIEEFLKALKP